MSAVLLIIGWTSCIIFSSLIMGEYFFGGFGMYVWDLRLVHVGGCLWML